MHASVFSLTCMHALMHSCTHAYARGRAADTHTPTCTHAHMHTSTRPHIQAVATTKGADRAVPTRPTQVRAPDRRCVRLNACMLVHTPTDARTHGRTHAGLDQRMERLAREARAQQQTSPQDLAGYFSSEGVVVPAPATDMRATEVSLSKRERTQAEWNASGGTVASAAKASNGVVVGHTRALSRVQNERRLDQERRAAAEQLAVADKLLEGWMQSRIAKAECDKAAARAQLAVPPLAPPLPLALCSGAGCVRAGVCVCAGYQGRQWRSISIFVLCWPANARARTHTHTHRCMRKWPRA